MIRGTTRAMAREVDTAIAEAIRLANESLVEEPMILSVTVRAVKRVDEVTAVLLYDAEVEFGDRDAWWTL